MTDRGDRHAASFLGVVGDDFSGTAALAGELVDRGVECDVLLSGDDVGAAPATGGAALRGVAVSTDSRDLETADAYGVVRESAAALDGAGCDLIFKKIDSLLRGNVSSELRAVRDVFCGQTMLVAPAVPSEQRTTAGGVQLWDGVPVHTRTPGLTPSSSYLPDLLTGPAGPEVAILERPPARESVADVRDRLLALLQGGARIVVCDAETTGQLRTIAAAGLAARVRLFSGASAFGAMIVDELVAGPGHRAPGRTLVVVGSASAVARAQAQCLLAAGARPVQIRTAADAARAVQLAGCDTAAGRPDVILLWNGPGEKDSKPWIDQRVARLLATAAAQLLRELPITHVVATGGETALNLANELGVERIKPFRRIGAGIVQAALVGGSHDGLTIVTKPGAYGNEECLVHVVDELDRRVAELYNF